MQDSVRTPGRLTVMMPVVRPRQAGKTTELNALKDEHGRQLVHNIFVRKGLTYLMNKKGTGLKPVAQLIFNVNMERLASNESPQEIVRDLQSQLRLLRLK